MRYESKKIEDREEIYALFYELNSVSCDKISTIMALSQLVDWLHTHA